MNSVAVQKEDESDTRNTNRAEAPKDLVEYQYVDTRDIGNSIIHITGVERLYSQHCKGNR